MTIFINSYFLYEILKLISERHNMPNFIVKFEEEVSLKFDLKWRGPKKPIQFIQFI